eukprot:384133-Amphidinium_carterae.2
MRLQKLEEQVSALIDGLPSVRQPEAVTEVLVQSAAVEADPWMRAKQKIPDRNKARSSSPN